MYGFASRDQCKEALHEEPDGTFLLRFSESWVDGTSIDATGRISIAIKINGKTWSY